MPRSGTTSSASELGLDPPVSGPNAIGVAVPDAIKVAVPDGAVTLTVPLAV